MDKCANQFIKHFRNDDWGDSVLIMEIDGKAFARVYWFRDDNESIYLDMLSVCESQRKQGLGTKLQELRESIGVEMGANSAYLWVKKDSWMYNWYRRRGYEDCKDHEKEDGFIWMRKMLI